MALPSRRGLLRTKGAVWAPRGPNLPAPDCRMTGVPVREQTAMGGVSTTLRAAEQLEQLRTAAAFAPRPAEAVFDWSSLDASEIGIRLWVHFGTGF